MKQLTVTAELTELDHVLDFVNRFLEEYNCSPKIMIKIAIAVEEVFANIAHYAYSPNKGEVEIQCDTQEDSTKVIIMFIDGGYPFDPLKKENPDITLSTEERNIGGLGIYMVKKSMDEVMYEYKNKKNIFIIKKKINV